VFRRDALMQVAIILAPVIIAISLLLIIP